jgi:hypothetical protein
MKGVKGKRLTVGGGCKGIAACQRDVCRENEETKRKGHNEFI